MHACPMPVFMPSSLSACKLLAAGAGATTTVMTSSVGMYKNTSTVAVLASVPPGKI